MPSPEISNRWANIGLTAILALMGCEPKDDMKLPNNGQPAEFDGSISSPKDIQKVRFQIERTQLINQYPDLNLFLKLKHQIGLSQLCALYLDILERQVLSEGEADHKRALMDDIVKVMIDRLSQPMEDQDFGKCFEVDSSTAPQELVNALTQALPRLTFEQLLTTYKSATGIHKETIATEAINRLLSKDQTMSITSENIVEALIGPLESNPDQHLEILQIYIHSLELHHLARVYREVENAEVRRLLAEEMLNAEKEHFKNSDFTLTLIFLAKFPEMQKAVIEKWAGSLQPEYPNNYAYPPVYRPGNLEELQEPRKAPEELQEPRKAAYENYCKHGHDEFGYPLGRCVRSEPMPVWSSVL